MFCKFLLVQLLLTYNIYCQPICIYGNCQDGYGIHLLTDGRKWEGTFKNGRWDGYGFLTYEKGNILLGYWIGGVLDKSRPFNKETNPYNQFNADRLPDGLWVTFHSNENHSPNGSFPANPNHIQSIGRYKNGNKDGRWIIFNESSIIKDEYYIDGVPNGTWITYWEDGYIGYDRISIVETYKNGVLHGLYQEYSQFGNLLLLECTYVNDLKNGEEITYYPYTGYDKTVKPMIRSKSFFVNGLLEGDVIYYNKDGTIRKKDSYVKGTPKR